MEHALRVQICDDSPHIRSALRRLLEREPDLIVTAEAAGAEHAIEQLRAQRPDVLLLDITMPGRSGLEALPDLRAASPETGIIVLSLHDDPAYAHRAVAAGAHGHLAKEAADGLAQAVRDIANRCQRRSS
jgi:two-component system response regulator NreC